MFHSFYGDCGSSLLDSSPDKKVAINNTIMTSLRASSQLPEVPLNVVKSVTEIRCQCYHLTDAENMNCNMDGMDNLSMILLLFNFEDFNCLCRLQHSAVADSSLAGSAAQAIAHIRKIHNASEIAFAAKLLEWYSATSAKMATPTKNMTSKWFELFRMIAAIEPDDQPTIHNACHFVRRDFEAIYKSNVDNMDFRSPAIDLPSHLAASGEKLDHMASIARVVVHLDFDHWQLLRMPHCRGLMRELHRVVSNNSEDARRLEFNIYIVSRVVKLAECIAAMKEDVRVDMRQFLKSMLSDTGESTACPWWARKSSSGSSASCGTSFPAPVTQRWRISCCTSTLSRPMFATSSAIC